MKIKFDAKTAEKIKKLGEVDLVFDFDHTLSEKNTEVDACAGGISWYRIVTVEKGHVPEEIDATIESEFGPIYYKGDGFYFFQDEMYTVFNPSYNLIELRSTAERLSVNLLIVDFRGKKKSNFEWISLLIMEDKLERDFLIVIVHLDLGMLFVLGASKKINII